MTDRIALTKLHGLGNDFLVRFVDAHEAVRAVGSMAAFARRICERHRGVGADGLLLASPGVGPDAWGMTLYNADGSQAEMSGNGIRCFAQAVVRRLDLDLPTTLTVTTPGGEHAIAVVADPDGDPDRIVASVGMGRPGPGPVLPEGPRPEFRRVTRCATWALGNPHVVIEVEDPADVDLAVEGPAWEALFEGGINVHFVAAVAPGEVTQVTWERGAGITEACGTGATATALSMQSWGVVEDRVEVAMPGGRVTVELGEEPVLRGPSAWIAEIEVAA